MGMVASELPTISEKEFSEIGKWFQKAAAVVSENIAIEEKERRVKSLKADIAVLESVVRTSGNSVAATVRYERYWKAGPDTGKLYGVQTVTYHVQNVPISWESDSKTELRITGASFSESGYNGFVSAHTSSGHCSMFGWRLTVEWLETLRAKKALVL